jgi:type IV pilus assembly protein PilA
MDTQSDQSERATSPRVIKRRRAVLIIVGVLALVLIFAAILIPHNMVSRVAHDEASAVSGLRTLTSVELRYAAAHPSKGFTCDLAQLKTEIPSTAEHAREGFLFSDPFEGYKFSLTGCEADSDGVVVRYKATAVPVLPGKTGFRAFCTDQTGELRFSVNGSPEACRPL